MMSEASVANFPSEEAEEEVTNEAVSSEETAAVSNVPAEGQTQDVGGVAGERLRAFVERVERLEEEKTALMEDIKEIYGEAKAMGFDVKTLRKIVSLRKMETEKRREEDELLELYKSAIGMY